MKNKIVVNKLKCLSKSGAIIMGLLMAGATTAVAQTTAKDSSAQELIKKINNPVASLTSVPFQNNMDAGIGKYNGTRNTLYFQPVIPVTLSPELNLITRVVLPVISQKNISAEGSNQNGLADALVSVFLSPSSSKNGLIWGAGPVILVPTATDDLLGTKKLGLGPTAVLLKQTHGWTFGALINQIWSVAGNKDRADVSQFYLQPFLNHNWKSGAGIGLTSEITRNWQAGTTSVFIIPSISGITKIGKQTVQLSIGPRIHASAPEGSKADFGIRSSLVFIFPK